MTSSSFPRLNHISRHACVRGQTKSISSRKFCFFRKRHMTPVSCNGLQLRKQFIGNFLPSRSIVYRVLSTDRWNFSLEFFVSICPSPSPEIRCYVLIKLDEMTSFYVRQFPSRAPALPIM